MSAESVRIVEQIEELIHGDYDVKIFRTIENEGELEQYDLYTVEVKNENGVIVAEGKDTILSEAIDTAYRDTLEMEERSTPEPSRLENAQSKYQTLSVALSASWAKWAVENADLLRRLKAAKVELEAAERDSVGKA